MMAPQVMQSMHVWFHHVFVVIILGLVSQHQVLGQSNQAATWIYPTYDSPRIYNYLDSVNASWTTQWPDPWLHLWCKDNKTDSGNAQIHLYYEQVPPTASRLITLNYDSAFKRCHFQITPRSTRHPGLNGPNFEILKDDTQKPVTRSLDSTTIASSTPTSESATAPNPTSSTVSIPSTFTPTPALAISNTSAATTPAPTLLPSSRLSPATKASIGLACVASVLALTGAAYYLIRRRRRRKLQNHVSSNREEKGWSNQEGKAKKEKKQKKKKKLWWSPSKELSQLSDALPSQELNGVSIGELEG